MTNLPAPVKRMEVADLWRSDGTIGATNYLLWGTSLFGIKYGIDSFVAGTIFHRAWGFLSYLFPGQTLDFLALNAPDRAFFATIAVLALPFVWVGVILTMRRLRAVGLPVYLVYLFFVPFVNLLLFALLVAMPTIRIPKNVAQGAVAVPNPMTAVAPPAEAYENAVVVEPVEGDAAMVVAALGDAPQVIPPLPDWQKPDRSLPARKQAELTRAALNRSEMVKALAVTVPPSIGLAWLSMFVFQAYGWGTFVGLPFALGMMSAYLYGSHELRTFKQSVGVSMIAVTLLGVSLFAFAWEGMACMVMAAPIVYFLAFMGSLLGHHMQKNKLRVVDRQLISAVMLLCMPLLMGAEYAAHPEPAIMPVTSVVEIAAPPAVVWHHVIAFPQLDPPEDWMFHVGIAYPIGATISGAGVGAVRRCRFSTGAFVEPIKVWDEPRLLRFGVTAQPPSMREFSWNHEIHPAHLQGYLDVQQGQFKLEELEDPNGGLSRTRLVGTTWYTNRMWPAPYWRLWSDDIMHHIHLRVLKHIQKNAEKEMRVTA